MQENIPVEEVFEKLKCTEEGLSSDEVHKRLDLFGYNKLEEKKVKENLLLILNIGLLIFRRKTNKLIFMVCI